MIVSVPVAVIVLLTTLTSSVTEPVLVPASVGTSFVPLIVTDTVVEAVPSKDVTVKLSVSDAPAPSDCTAVCVLLAA